MIGSSWTWKSISTQEHCLMFQLKPKHQLQDVSCRCTTICAPLFSWSSHVWCLLNVWWLLIIIHEKQSLNVLYPKLGCNVNHSYCALCVLALRLKHNTCSGHQFRFFIETEGETVYWCSLLRALWRSAKAGIFHLTGRVKGSQGVTSSEGNLNHLSRGDQQDPCHHHLPTCFFNPYKRKKKQWPSRNLIWSTTTSLFFWQKKN